MTRKWIIVPALLLGSALFLTASTASAHPTVILPHHRGHIVPIVRPIIRPVPIIVPTPIYRPVPIAITAPLPIASPFRVVYRTTCNEPWLTYNFYNSPAYASDVAASLQAQNLEAQVWSR